MIITDKDIYSEVYSVLNLLGKDFIDKIPKDIYKMIEEKRNKDYNPLYTYELPLKKQNINKRSLSIIAFFDINYWSNQERKLILKNKFKQNEINNQKKLREKYNPDEIFIKNVKKEYVQNKDDNNNNLIKRKESILRRFINKFKRFFGKN